MKDLFTTGTTPCRRGGCKEKAIEGSTRCIKHHCLPAKHKVQVILSEVIRTPRNLEDVARAVRKRHCFVGLAGIGNSLRLGVELGLIEKVEVKHKPLCWRLPVATSKPQPRQKTEQAPQKATRRAVSKQATRKKPRPRVQVGADGKRASREEMEGWVIDAVIAVEEGTRKQIVAALAKAGHNIGDHSVRKHLQNLQHQKLVTFTMNRKVRGALAKYSLAHKTAPEPTKAAPVEPTKAAPVEPAQAPSQESATNSKSLAALLGSFVEKTQRRLDSLEQQQADLKQQSAETKQALEALQLLLADAKPSNIIDLSKDLEEACATLSKAMA